MGRFALQMMGAVGELERNTIVDNVKMCHPRSSRQSDVRGLTRCPECGAAMSASRTVNKMKDGTKVTRMYYSCGSFRSKGSSVCHANSIRKLEAEKAVTDRIQNVLAKPALLKTIFFNRSPFC